MRASDRTWTAVVLTIIIVLFLLHAWHYRFLEDDAYIFLRYARNLVAGHGPVWNPGERVEGYTSPLWLAIVSLVVAIVPRPETALHAVTLALGVVSLLLTAHLASRLCGSRIAGLAGAALLASDRSFAVWSTSGMDTRLFGTLVLLLAVAVCRILDATDRGGAQTEGSVETGTTRGLFLGGTLALLSLARPEGIALSALAVVFLLARDVIGSSGYRTPRSAAPFRRAPAVGLWLGAVGSLLAFRIGYYGELLPNTFFAKVTGPDLGTGLGYLRHFASAYPHEAAVYVVVAVVALARTRREPGAGFLALIAAAWAVYLIAVGGDFMEFRFLDAVTPLLIVLLVAGSWRLLTLQGGASAALLAAALALFAVSSIWSGATLERRAHGVICRQEMAEETTEWWVVVGKWLGRYARPGESIATTAAGAIPYYSGLRAIDMHGLNDPTIARQEADPGAYIGHRKMARAAWLDERGVTYILGHPRIRATIGELAPTADQIVVVLNDPDGKVNVGRDFFLAFRTSGDRDALATALRERGARVVF